MSLHVQQTSWMHPVRIDRTTLMQQSLAHEGPGFWLKSGTRDFGSNRAPGILARIGHPGALKINPALSLLRAGFWRMDQAAAREAPAAAPEASVYH